MDAAGAREALAHLIDVTAQLRISHVRAALHLLGRQVLFPANGQLLLRRHEADFAFAGNRVDRTAGHQHGKRTGRNGETMADAQTSQDGVEHSDTTGNTKRYTDAQSG